MQDRERLLDSITFQDFVLKYEERLRAVAALMSVPFEGTIPGLETQIGVLSSKMEFLSWCLALAEALETNARAKWLVEKDKGMTDMDRKTRLEDKISFETKTMSWIKFLCDDIDKYLSNAQSVLATKRAELNRFGHGGE